MAEKTAKKTAKSPRNGAEIPLGNHPGNTGGKKGRSGRKPDWIKAFCDNLLADPKAQQQVKEILQDKNHAAFSRMWVALADRAHGRPKETVDINKTEVVYLVEAPPKFTNRDAWQQQYTQN